MRAIPGFLLVFVLVSGHAAGQSSGSRWHVSAALSRVDSGEFDRADVGVTGRVAWYPVPVVGAEVEVGLYPQEFGDPVAFSRRRFEGLFGVTVGPRLGRLRAFASVRPGFVTFSGAPRPIACVAIVPPTLLCRLSVGATVFAVGVGGGVEAFPGGRTVLRFDIGDRLMRYPGPVLDRALVVRQGGFYGHEVRLAVGGGVRF